MSESLQKYRRNIPRLAKELGVLCPSFEGKTKNDLRASWLFLNEENKKRKEIIRQRDLEEAQKAEEIVHGG